MLRLLLVRYGHAVSRETTARFIGAAGSTGVGGRSIDALVSRIRLRLRSAGIDNVRIESVRGTGYTLIVPYVVMIIGLLVRPYGMFGTPEIRRV